MLNVDKIGRCLHGKYEKPIKVAKEELKEYLHKDKNDGETLRERKTTNKC